MTKSKKSISKSMYRYVDINSKEFERKVSEIAVKAINNGIRNNLSIRQTIRRFS